MRFYSRGKLLISGEYLVLNGATALAVPLKSGQVLRVDRSGNQQELTWESIEDDKPWFTAKLKLPFFDVVETSDITIAENLVRYLIAMVRIKPEFASELLAAKVITKLEFKREWGFGSSSSLVSNLAYWAGLDPYTLHKEVSSGSGYDVICARHDGPIYYNVSKRGYKLEALDIFTPLTKSIYFIYLGKKKDSAKSVAKFLANKKSYKSEIELVSGLTRHMGDAKNIDDFAYYMKEHEQIFIILKKPTLKEGFFKDLSGEIKSLGAWGGDFAMIVWNESRKELIEYLLSKNITIQFSFDELINTR